MYLNRLNEEQLIKICRNKDNEYYKEAVDAILLRYSKTIKAYSNVFWSRNKSSACLEDFISEASLAVIVAISNFDNKSKNTFKTYLCRSIEFSLRTFISQKCSIIKVTSRNVSIKNYFSGYYDNLPERKLRIEKELNIKTDDDKNKAWSKYKNLFLQTQSIDASSKNSTSDNQSNAHDYLNKKDEQIQTSSQVENKLIILQFMKRLNGLQKDIFKMFYGDGCSKKEVATILNIDESIVASELRVIKSFSNKYARTLESENSLL